MNFPSKWLLSHRHHHNIQGQSEKHEQGKKAYVTPQELHPVCSRNNTSQHHATQEKMDTLKKKKN
jgi:hypothetical protein